MIDFQPGEQIELTSDMSVEQIQPSGRCFLFYKRQTTVLKNHIFVSKGTRGFFLRIDSTHSYRYIVDISALKLERNGRPVILGSIDQRGISRIHPLRLLAEIA